MPILHYIYYIVYNTFMYEKQGKYFNSKCFIAKKC